MIPCDLHTVKNDNVLKYCCTQLPRHIFVQPDPHVFEIIEDCPIDSISHHGEISSFFLSQNLVVKHFKLGSLLYQHTMANRLLKPATVHPRRIPLSPWGHQFPYWLPNKISG